MHLHSLSKNEHVRVRVVLPDNAEGRPSLPSVESVWPAADWFEREAYDLYGFDFAGHPNLHRILCHDAFVGHALRKDYAPGQRWFYAEEDLRFPEWAKHTEEKAGHFETQTISIGPSHPTTHGIIHLIARLDGETIVKAETIIGYLHRCFEKMAEKHHWNQVIPYTDRLNYVSAMLNGVGYVRTVEKMLGDRGPGPRPARADDPLRVHAHHGSLRVHRSEPRRHRGADELHLPLPEPREHLRPPRGLLRRPAHGVLRARRGAGDRRARTTSSRAAGAFSRRSRCSSTTSRSSSRTTGSCATASRAPES